MDTRERQQRCDTTFDKGLVGLVGTQSCVVAVLYVLVGMLVSMIRVLFVTCCLRELE